MMSRETAIGGASRTSLPRWCVGGFGNDRDEWNQLAPTVEGNHRLSREDLRRRREDLSQAWLDAGGCTGRLSTSCVSVTDDSFGPPISASEQPANLVNIISCIACSHILSERALRVETKTQRSFFSTDRQPHGIRPLGSAKRMPGMCDCMIRDFACNCGEMIGYEMVISCAECRNEAEDLHPWLMSAQHVQARPRVDPNGIQLVWPPPTPKSKYTTPMAGVQDENEPTFANQFFTPVVPPLPKYGREDNILCDLNGRARESSLRQKDANRADRMTLEEREAQVAEQGAMLFAKEIALDDREQFLRDKEAAVERFTEELKAREVTVEILERVVREKEQQVKAEHASAWTEVGEAMEDAHQAEILAKAHSDVAAALKKQNEEVCARVEQAEGDALNRAAEVQKMQSLAERLRSDVSLKVAEIENMKEDALALRASRRQMEDELAAKTAEELATRRRFEEELASKDRELNAIVAEKAAVKDDLHAANEELASTRLSARRLEEELETIRAALRQGEAHAAFAPASSIVPPPQVASAAAPAPRRRVSTSSRFAAPSTVHSAVPPPPPRGHTSSAVPPLPARGHSLSALRTLCSTACGYGTVEFVPFPVRLQPPSLLSWARRLVCCCRRRHEGPGGPGVLFTMHY